MLIIFLCFGAGALAQDSAPRALEEIIVTAQYREQGLQDVPISITSVTGDMLMNTALQRADDIQFLVPNFTLTETGISSNTFIRGIGSGVNQAFEQSVGTYIDGVYYGRAQQIRSPFLDLERVEVLRGPQSILFGKNSVAGALNITTAKPTDSFEGHILVSNEFEHDETIIEGAISGPLSDKVRGRIAARSRNLDGYMTNATLGMSEPNREDWTVRGTLELDITPSFAAMLKVEVGEFDVRGRNIEIINESPGASGFEYNQILTGLFGQDASVSNVVQDGVRSSNGDFSFNESSTYALTLDWDVGDYGVRSISAYTDFEYDEFCDCDFTGANVIGAALQERYTQISQEIRLTSPLNNSYDYIAGVYYQTSDHDFFDQIIVPPNSILVPALNGQSAGAGDAVSGTEASREATVDSDVLSAFAQFNWHLSDVVTLQLGARVTQDERDGLRTLSIVAEGGGALPAPQIGAAIVYANGFGITSTNLFDPLLQPAGAFFISQLGALPVTGTRDKAKFSPEVKLVWDASDSILLFLSWANGFKSGSFDFRANNRSFYADMATSFEFEDEEAQNIELGGKFTLANGALEINATAFFTDFSDLQISLFDGTLGFNVGNAASAEVKGLELDGRWAATGYLTISGGIAFTDFEFTDFKNGQCYFGQPPDTDVDGDGTLDHCDYTGNSNQMVSDFQGNLAFDFAIPLGAKYELSALIDVFYTSEYDASATFDPGLVQGGYSRFNARFGFGPDDGKWEVALLGKNLSDEETMQFGGDTPLAGSTFGSKSNYAFYSQGRTVTLQGVLRF